MEVILRKVDVNDMQEVWEIVYELAVFEKEPESVITTPEIYKKDFEANLFEAHVATVNNQIVGLILYYDSYSTWKGKMLYLDDFVVKSEFRNLNIGTLLFDKLIEIAKEKDVALIKWQVLHWNKDAIRFYEKYCASIDKEWFNGRLFL
jgi:ribosomal protein S18 acetylase RimI-like enzyme